MTDRDGKQYHQRVNALTQEDLANITSIFESIYDKKIKAHHIEENCRFQGIDTNDLRAMIDAHKKFSAAMDDSKTIIRRYILIFALTGLSGLTVYGYWAKITDMVKKTFLGQ